MRYYLGSGPWGSLIVTYPGARPLHANTIKHAVANLADMLLHMALLIKKDKSKSNSHPPPFPSLYSMLRQYRANLSCWVRSSTLLYYLRDATQSWGVTSRGECVVDRLPILAAAGVVS